MRLINLDQHFNQQQGFTLIETLVAAGVAAVVGAVLFGFMSSSFDIFARLKNSTEVADTMGELRAVLAVNKQCTSNFIGLPMDSAPLAQKIRQFNFKAGPPTFTDVLKLGDVANKLLNIKQIMLKKKIVLSTELIIADLEIQFTVNKTKDLVIRSVPIFAIMDKNLIKECWMKQDRSSLEYNQACMALSNGAYTYDPTGQKCDLNNGQWFNGTEADATCPGNKVLPPNASKEFHCMELPPVGFIDANYYPPTYYNFQNGAPGQFESGREAWQCYIVGNNSCKCGIGVGIPQAGWKASIFCVDP